MANEDNQVQLQEELDQILRSIHELTTNWRQTDLFNLGNENFLVSTCFPACSFPAYSFPTAVLMLIGFLTMVAGAIVMGVCDTSLAYCPPEEHLEYTRLGSRKYSCTIPQCTMTGTIASCHQVPSTCTDYWCENPLTGTTVDEARKRGNCFMPGVWTLVAGSAVFLLCLSEPLFKRLVNMVAGCYQEMSRQSQLSKLNERKAHVEQSLANLAGNTHVIEVVPATEITEHPMPLAQ